MAEPATDEMKTFKPLTLEEVREKIGYYPPSKQPQVSGWYHDAAIYLLALLDAEIAARQAAEARVAELEREVAKP